MCPLGDLIALDGLSLCGPPLLIARLYFSPAIHIHFIITLLTATASCNAFSVRLSLRYTHFYVL